MKNKSLIIIVIQAVMIVMLVWIILILGGDEFFAEDDSEGVEEIVVDYTQSINDLTYVTLPLAVEKNSGITTIPIQSTSKSYDYASYGEVMSLTNLFLRKNNLGNLLRNKNKIEKQLEEESEHLKKLIILNQDNKNIADSIIHEKEIDISNLENDLAVIQNDISNVLINTEHHWGPYFAKLIAQTEKKVSSPILSNKNRLIKVTIPSVNLPKTPPKEIDVYLSSDENISYAASFISKAPNSDASLQGKSFYYEVESTELNVGAKIKANIKNTNDNRNEISLFIHRKSVVWSNGKPWIFIKVGSDGYFLRKPLISPLETSGGWLVEEGPFKEGELLVTDGAQLLLSEEFKYQIKNENED